MSSKQPPGTVGVMGIGVMGSRVAAALAETGLNVIGHDTLFQTIDDDILDAYRSSVTPEKLYQVAARTAG